MRKNLTTGLSAGSALLMSGAMLLGTMSAAAAPAAPAAPASSAATAAAPSGVATTTFYLRTAPGTQYNVVRTVTKGQRLSLSCYVYGYRVKATWGYTALWYRVSTGGYAPDAYLSTGTTAPLASTPLCGWAATDRRDRAVDWFKRRNGQAVYDGLCQKAVELAYGREFVYASATAAYRAAVTQGKLKTTGIPPKGAWVYWAASTSNGHVALSLGDGRVFSTNASGGRIGIGTLSMRSGYRGWSVSLV